MPTSSLCSQRAFLQQQQQKVGPAFLGEAPHSTSCIVMVHSTNIHSVSTTCQVRDKLHTIQDAKLSTE